MATIFEKAVKTTLRFSCRGKEKRRWEVQGEKVMYLKKNDRFKKGHMKSK